MTIRTNNVPRLIIDGYELTSEERGEFDYYSWPNVKSLHPYPSKDGEEAIFVRYWGQLFDLGEFTATELEGWHGIQTDTFFSGTLVRFVDEDHVIVGRVYA